jgi:hypothetical protein
LGPAGSLGSGSHSVLSPFRAGCLLLDAPPKSPPWGVTPPPCARSATPLIAAWRSGFGAAVPDAVASFPGRNGLLPSVEPARAR